MRPLLFIVGAGASKDFGTSMPVGTELARHIEDILAHDFSGTHLAAKGPVAASLSLSRTGLNSKLFLAGQQIRKSLIHQTSIDDLLDEWSNDFPEMVRVAKTALAYIILKAERESRLHKTGDRSQDAAIQCVADLRDSWLAYLVQNIRRTVRRRDIAAAFSGVGFIVFNYDRCIEQYLFWAFQTAGLNKSEAVEALSQIPIVHVYGTIGRLPLYGGHEKYTDFGLDTAYLDDVASRIKTYTEEDHDPINLSRIHDLVLAAKRIVFLGFGYHHKNMELLFSKGMPADCDIWGASERPDNTRRRAASERLFKSGERPAIDRLTTHGCREFLELHREILD